MYFTTLFLSIFYLVYQAGKGTFRDSVFKPFAHNTLLQSEDVDTGAPLRALDDVQMPMTTQGRWIIDQTGKRVKLACVNFASHMEALIPEGMGDQPLHVLMEKMVEMGFNCVRFTMSVEMIEKFDHPIDARLQKYLSQYTRERLYHLHPEFVNATVYDVFKATMDLLKQNNLMVVLDNHVSRATWCCGLLDDNRWWDRDSLNLIQSSSAPSTSTKSRFSLQGNSEQEVMFPANPWLLSLIQMAEEASRPEWNHIIGIGLRNEVHSFKFGKSQEEDWFKYMRLAAQAVHQVNPDLLIVVGGLSSASYLKNLKDQALFTIDNPIRKQIVYEFHYYNQIYIYPLWRLFGYKLTCHYMHWFLNSRVGFIIDEPNDQYTNPIWLSEFGVHVEKLDINKPNSPDLSWLKCLSGWMNERDVDFGYWVLNGHYYVREEKLDFEEQWGLLNSPHDAHRNMDLVRILQSFMRINQGPGHNNVTVQA
ncbi:hypothetical protein MIR68_007022 [Amoeboaphelidium protococcarum]|nr:hypothetical protein MIR68_007022 [Amoeboaphelidium protococcarum]